MQLSFSSLREGVLDLFMVKWKLPMRLTWGLSLSEGASNSFLLCANVCERCSEESLAAVCLRK